VRDRFEERVGAAIAALVDAVQRRPLWVVFGYAVATVVSVLYAVENLGIRGDTDSLFAHDIPFKVAERRFQEAFPGQVENIFVVVDGVTPERASTAAEALAKRLRENRRDFHMVYLPGGGEFFERNAFLYLDTAELEDLADRLAEAQPYLAELSQDGSLGGLASILARGARAVRDGDVKGEQLAAMYERSADAFAALRQGRPYQLSWAEVLASRDFGGDPHRRVLLVEPALDVNDLQPARAAILSVRAAAQELGFDEASGVSVRITGDVALSYEEMGVVKSQAAASGIASLVLVGVLLTIGLRSVRMVAATLVTLVIGMLLTVGFTALAIGHYNMISAAFAVLYIGLGVEFAIHLLMRYQEMLSEGQPAQRALRETARDVGTSLALSATTTAIGFFAFVPTEFVGVAELGVISGAGTLISAFATLTLLPALVALWSKQQERGVSFGDAVWTTRVIDVPVKYPRAVRFAALALAVASVLVLPRARFDNNPLNVRDPGSESVRALSDLLERGAGSPWSLNVMAPDIAGAESVAERLRELPQVARVITVSDFVPADQDEKLDIIEDVALFLGPVAATDGSAAAADAETRSRVEALRHLELELQRLLRDSSDPAIQGSAGRLAHELDAYLGALPAGPHADVSLDRLEATLVGGLPEQLRILNAALTAGRVTLENLPEALMTQMVGENGLIRVQIFPSANLADHASLAEFVDAVKAAVPGMDVTGSAAEIVESGRTVVRSLQQALLLALVAITGVVLLLWGGRVTETALVLTPLGLAAIFTAATAIVFGIPFNVADVIVLPLLLGMGVDSGIHLVHRARATGELGIKLLGTSTARAVAFSGINTVASFGTLAFSTHRGLATLGQLLTLGVFFTMLTTLIVLPALIPARWRREARGGLVPASDVGRPGDYST
jgi:hopanoid biosynthesis associated RND transporter like protein HpnN